MNYGGSGFTDNSTTNYRIFSTAKSHTEESTGYITVAGNGAVPSPTDGTPPSIMGQVITPPMATPSPIRFTLPTTVGQSSLLATSRPLL